MMFLFANNIRWRLFVLTGFLVTSACSQTPSADALGSVGSAETGAPSEMAAIDPYEGVNRQIFAFNKGLDDNFIKPVATAYKAVTPERVDNSITNFFMNLDDARSAINNLLQMKPGEALVDTERVLYNSTFGIAGLIDVATPMGMEKHKEDFGQTLASWGVDSGPYVMLPFLGPSTVRDSIAKLSVDRLTNPRHYSKYNLELFALDKLDQRADLFTDEAAFEDISDDQYSALRDLWLQRRANKIRDGKQDAQQHSDLIDELEALDDE